MSKYEGMLTVGQQFNDWTVLSEDIIVDNWGRARVQVQCKCGREFDRDLHSLMVGRSKSCQKCAHTRSRNGNWQGYKDIPLAWFSRIYRHESRRKWECDITVEYVHELWLKQDRRCALSGLPIGWDGNIREGEFTASIDRIDSTLGYIKGNVQLLHKDVNLMKNKFNQEYFVEMCTRIAQG